MSASSLTRSGHAAARSCNDAVSLLRRSLHLRTSDDISVLDHSLQTADLLRHAFPDDLELQLAGLLHDIDSVIGCHPSQHGLVGAEYLAPIFPDDLVGMIRLHVRAKRYLVSVDPEYRRRLSPDSDQMLEVQGLPMTDEQIRAFEADEQARRLGGRTSTLLSWVSALHEVSQTKTWERQGLTDSNL
jgi:predicted HD phosphohydrolase